mmetsp:Transcript_3775/g.5274  ORF Transcript_3775/g.5274 Transcript_3775/m.5274 type:complete len:256 (-) Transcript_3775:70-837(-)
MPPYVQQRFGKPKLREGTPHNLATLRFPNPHFPILRPRDSISSIRTKSASNNGICHVASSEARVDQLKGCEVKKPQAVLVCLHQQLASSSCWMKRKTSNGFSNQVRVLNDAHHVEVPGLDADPSFAPHQDHPGPICCVQPPCLLVPNHRVHVALVLHNCPQHPLVNSSAACIPEMNVAIKASREHNMLRVLRFGVSHGNALKDAAVHKGRWAVLKGDHQVRGEVLLLALPRTLEWGTIWAEQLLFPTHTLDNTVD